MLGLELADDKRSLPPRAGHVQEVVFRVIGSCIGVFTRRGAGGAFFAALLMTSRSQKLTLRLVLLLLPPDRRVRGKVRTLARQRL